MNIFACGLEQWSARLAHNQKVSGSNPLSVTNFNFMQIYLKYVLFHGWKHIDKSEFPKNETYANGVPFYCLDSKTNDRVHYMCVKIEHLIEPEIVSDLLQK